MRFQLSTDTRASQAAPKQGRSRAQIRHHKRGGRRRNSLEGYLECQQLEAAAPLREGANETDDLDASSVRGFQDGGKFDAGAGASARDSDSDLSTTACGSAWSGSREESDEVEVLDDDGVTSEQNCGCTHPGDTPAEARSCVENVCLLSCFLELSQLCPADAGTTSVLLHTISLLRRCGYSAEEICAVLAHASVYFEEAVVACAGRFQRAPGEAGYVLALLTYLAHCHVLDETCPLRLWHRYLFQRYCTLGLLDKVVLRLLSQRGYRLRVADDELAARFGRLLACFGRTWEPRGPEVSPTAPPADSASYVHVP